MVDWTSYRTWGSEALSGARLPAWTTAVAVVLIAYSAARLTWMLVPSVTPQDVPPSAVVGPAASRADALTLGREIVSRHLFGQAPSLTASSSAAIPETSLSLVLRGVVASADPKTAAAIIADPSGAESFYLVGQEMPGGAVLKEVHAQHIVLSRGGRFETLRLPENALKTDSGDADAAAAPGVPAVTVSPQAGALLRQYRDQFMQNPESLANLLQGEPAVENGRLVGYRLRPGRDAGALAQFGIQSGDVVTAINGVSLADPAGRMSLLSKLPGATEFDLSLLRNGQPVSISVPVGGRT